MENRAVRLVATVVTVGGARITGAEGVRSNVSEACELISVVNALATLTLYIPSLAGLTLGRVRIAPVFPGRDEPLKNHWYARGRGIPTTSTLKVASSSAHTTRLVGCCTILNGIGPVVTPGDATSSAVAAWQAPPRPILLRAVKAPELVS